MYKFYISRNYLYIINKPWLWQFGCYLKCYALMSNLLRKCPRIYLVIILAGTPGSPGPWLFSFKELRLMKSLWGEAGLAWSCVTPRITKNKVKSSTEIFRFRNWNTTFSLSPHQGASASSSCSSSPRADVCKPRVAEERKEENWSSPSNEILLYFKRQKYVVYLITWQTPHNPVS